MDYNDKQVGKNKNFLTSLHYACEGIITAVKEERNMRKHIVCAVIALLAGWLFKLNISEWLWLLFVIFAVLVMEMVNTIFENTVDLIVGNKFHPLAKKIKDVAAGAVLLTSIFAVIVGCFIFIPKLLTY